jgi:hypothetical protein
MPGDVKSSDIDSPANTERDDVLPMPAASEKDKECAASGTTDPRSARLGAAARAAMKQPGQRR